MANSLRPAFDAVLRDAGIDMGRADAVANATARIRELRARDADAAHSLLFCLRNLASLPQPDAAVRQRLLDVLQTFQEPRSLELDNVRSRWEREQVDGFGPYLTAEALAPLDSDQLTELAGQMGGIAGREAVTFELIDRALLKKPDSFAVHFMRAGLSLQAAAQRRLEPPAAPFVQSAVEHLRAAMALRPRSGLARMSLAAALAMQTMLGDDRSGFAVARAMMLSATEVEPRTPLVWYLRADYLTHSPDGKQEAIAACRQALQLDRDFAPARRLLEQLDK
jgi:hypothetical protein